ncbi:MAG TPA: hypothetical protein VNS02_08780 [Rhizobiaceae bacterium]|nr:hypothetical protein [Rhizobiaceae bacterium]
MRYLLNENAKRRLTERAQLSVAVDVLLANGIAVDEVAPQLCRYYYVDIDLLNEVLAAVPPTPATSGVSLR